MTLRRSQSFTTVFTVAITLLCLMLMSGNSLAQDRKNPWAVANASLKKISPHITKETCTVLGFKTPDEFHQARLGSPISMYMIKFDKLKSHDQSKDIKTLMHDLKKKLYPVFVGETIRSELIVRQLESGEWEMVSLGGSRYARVLHAVRNLHGKDRKYFIVEIPDLHQRFLGYKDGRKKMYFIALFHHHKLIDLNPKKALPAQRVVKLIKKLKSQPHVQSLKD